MEPFKDIEVETVAARKADAALLEGPMLADEAGHGSQRHVAPCSPRERWQEKWEPVFRPASRPESNIRKAIRRGSNAQRFDAGTIVTRSASGCCD